MGYVADPGDEMADYRTPGVYFEWRDTRRTGVQPVRTDIAGFVGVAERGPLHTPLLVEDWGQFISLFGRHLSHAYLAYAVQAFFANGGETCYVVRVADPDSARRASLDLLSDLGQPLLRLTASSSGTWSESLSVTAWLTAPRRFTLILRLLTTGEQEIWRDLNLDENDPRYAITCLNGHRVWLNEEGPNSSRWQQVDDCQGQSGRSAQARHVAPASALVEACILDRSCSSPKATMRLIPRETQGSLKDGADGLWTLRPDHLGGVGTSSGQAWGLAALENIPDVSIVAIPDIMLPAPQANQKPPAKLPSCLPDEADEMASPPSASDPDVPRGFTPTEIRDLQRALIGHCEKMKNRLAVLDPHPADVTFEAIRDWRRQFDTTYAALYHPWVRMRDPLHLDGLLRAVPPSGHVAGVYARVERQSGVHKPPANELLEEAEDVTLPVDDILHGVLNDNEVNIIRAYRGRGLRIVGACTLSSESEWRYVNVRRLLIMIERAIDQQTQWIAFEPNNNDTWRDTDRVIRSFLDGLWRRGMLDGITSEEAYRVICDETSNPPSEVNLGRLTTVVGVLPPWPAEFIIMRIGRTDSGTQVLEESRG